MSVAGWGLNFVEPCIGLCHLSAAMNLVALLSSQVAGCFLAHAHFGLTYTAFVVDVVHVSSVVLVLLLLWWRWSAVKAKLDSLGQVRSGQVRSGQVRSGQVRSTTAMP